MKALFLALVIITAFTPRSEAYLLVEDIPNLTHNIISQVENYAKYIQEVANQLTQITNQVTQITNQVTELRRFGDPNYYVNLLNLGAFTSTVSVLTSGVGNTIAQYRQAANGALALTYTANGLYSNLQGTVDRFGNTVQYNTDAFRKFSAVNDMVEGYNTQQRTYNSQLASLEQQLATAIQNLNSSSDHMSTQKYAAQVQAVSAQINALGHTTNLTGQRAQMQQVANQNDAARVQEASRQQLMQEQAEDVRRLATGFGTYLQN